MKGCKGCPAYAKCTVTYRGSACAALRGTYGIDSDPEIVTNADRIRAMTDEKLAGFLCGVMTAECCDRSCPGRETCEPGHKGLLDWLLKPAEEET